MSVLEKLCREEQVTITTRPRRRDVCVPADGSPVAISYDLVSDRTGRTVEISDESMGEEHRAAINKLSAALLEAIDNAIAAHYENASK